jgi:chromosome partitioning protein
VDLAGAEIELVDKVGRENRLKDALESLYGIYDFIILDTPPSLSLLTVNVLSYAKEVIVPCQTHPYAYSALDELFDTIFAVRENINTDLRVIGVVATLFDSRTRISHSILEKLKNDSRYSDLLFDTVIRTNTTIAESAGAGKPVIFFRPSSFGSEDYTRLAQELLKPN